MTNVYEKAKVMPHFILLASDTYTTRLIMRWMKAAKRDGIAPEKIKQVNDIYNEVRRWRNKNKDKCKLAD